MTINQLEQLGLTRRETNLYIHLLKSGPASATDSAAALDMPRPNIYEVAKTLNTKGLIRYSLTNRGKLLVAESPKRIEAIAQEKLALAKSLVPGLLELGTVSGFQSSITFFEGKKAMQNLMWEALGSKKKEISFLWSPKDMDKILGKKLIEKFIAERLKRNIKIRSLRPVEKESFYAIESTSSFGKEMTGVAYVPEDYSFSLSMALFDNKVAFFSSQNESFGFFVESKEFSKVMTMFYNSLWSNSGKLTVK